MITRDVTIKVTIPLPYRHDAEGILHLVTETLEDRFSEVDDPSLSDGATNETVADRYGFGGNTILLACEDYTEEIRL